MREAQELKAAELTTMREAQRTERQTVRPLGVWYMAACALPGRGGDGLVPETDDGACR